MSTTTKISPYLISAQKRYFDLTLASILLILGLPLILMISLINVFVIGFPIIFRQKRLGQNNIPFTIYKFRTMSINASAKQKQLKYLNEADGPVFKIKSDPRFVGIGKWLANSGLDELPQLINVINGDMSLVGPRPLPVSEARQIHSKYQSRHFIKPGITSSWVTAGSHHLKFNQWMELDQEYLSTASVISDVRILALTVKVILHVFKQQLPQVI